VPTEATRPERDEERGRAWRRRRMGGFLRQRLGDEGVDVTRDRREEAQHRRKGPDDRHVADARIDDLGDRPTVLAQLGG
jgi:hypothetical protein